jgi:hypothetical protein
VLYAVLPAADTACGDEETSVAEDFMLQEVLSDADAYFAVGDARRAIDVLFQGWDQFKIGRMEGAVEAIRLVLARICHSFWVKRDFETGTQITALVVSAALARTRRTVDPEFAAVYAQAIAATGTSPFPLRRIFRHQNLVHLFRRICADVAGDVAECGCARGLSFGTEESEVQITSPWPTFSMR